MPEKPLPWYRIFHPRCKAYLEPTNITRFWGRCELEANHVGEDHALERGMIYVRWAKAIPKLVFH